MNVEYISTSRKASHFSSPFSVQEMSLFTIFTGTSAPVAIFLAVLWKGSRYTQIFLKTIVFAGRAFSSLQVASLCVDVVLNLLLLIL